MVSYSDPPVKVQFSDSEAGMTPNGGVELWLRAAEQSGAFRDLPAGVSGRQGWTDGQMMLSLCLLNVLGWECADDLDRMEADEGLCRLVSRHEARILGVSRRSLRGRHRKGRQRTFPSSRSLLDWLHGHEDEAAGRARAKGEAYVPVPSATLAPLAEANRRLVAQTVAHAELRRATLDVDATIVPSGKKEALATYRSAKGTHPGETGYQPLNCFLAETGSMLCTEMRDGNVPAREGNARVLLRALELLPETIEEVMVRSDSAGHAAEVLRLCNRPELRPAATRRFGVVGFAISAVRSQELMAAVAQVPEAEWKPLRVLKKREPEGGGKPVLVEVDSPVEAIAEVNFVSNEDGYSKREGIIRYIAVRRALPDALGVNDDELPHDDGKPAYAIRVLITNIPAPGEGRKDGLGPKAMSAQAVLKLLNGRCGDSERAHDALKNGLAGGTMPSGRFGANAAWWLAALLAHNLHTLTAWWSLDEDLARATWKRIRRVLLVHAGRLIESGRQLILRMRKTGTEELQAALQNLDTRSTVPS